MFGKKKQEVKEEKFVNPAYSSGNVVYLKSGSDAMCVESTIVGTLTYYDFPVFAGYLCCCVWMEGNVVFREKFREECLKLVENNGDRRNW